ncbi:MAG TPA: MFS transporter [Gaiellaceae bacterium]|nr:MFS transporter [Gaiellaceae bacterium]
MRLRRLGALEERPFRLLWIGRTTSSFGDAITNVAFAFAILEVSSATGLGVVFAIATISRTAFTLIGGVWADRISRRLVMLVADVLRGGTQCALGVLWITDAIEVWHFGVAAAVVGGASAFFGPASTGFIPDTVGRARLQEANALISLSDGAAHLAGPALAGVLIAAFGLGFGLLFDAATFGVSALALALIRVHEHDERRERRRFVHELAEGWREVRARAWLQVAFASFALGNLGIAVFFVLGPQVFAEELGGARDWGIAMSIAAAGGIAGSVAALRLRPRHPLRVSFPIVMGGVLATLSLVPPLPAVLVGLAAASFFFGSTFGNALWDTVVQRRIPRHVISRVNSYDWLISLVFMPLGYALAGPLADVIGRDTTLLAAAAAGTIAYLGPLLSREVRSMRRDDDAVETVPA